MDHTVQEHPTQLHKMVRASSGSIYALAILHPLCLHLVISSPSVPSNVPQNISTDSLSSTSIRVRWDPVPAIDQNGDITLYEVRYDPLETFNGQITTGYENTTDGSVLEITLESLQEYVEYNISVRAYTIVGAGPFSDGIVQRTDEDRKSICSHSMCILRY